MIRREIVLPAPREDVWEALTEPERLADWFANDVDLDLRPGGGASFRWSNGETRRPPSPRSSPSAAWRSSGTTKARSPSRSKTTTRGRG